MEKLSANSTPNRVVDVRRLFELDAEIRMVLGVIKYFDSKSYNDDGLTTEQQTRKNKLVKELTALGRLRDEIIDKL